MPLTGHIDFPDCGKQQDTEKIHKEKLLGMYFSINIIQAIKLRIR
jgi:hypothetical protein